MSRGVVKTITGVGTRAHRRQGRTRSRVAATGGRGGAAVGVTRWVVAERRGGAVERPATPSRAEAGERKRQAVVVFLVPDRTGSDGRGVVLPVECDVSGTWDKDWKCVRGIHRGGWTGDRTATLLLLLMHRSRWRRRQCHSPRLKYLCRLQFIFSPYLNFAEYLLQS